MKILLVEDDSLIVAKLKDLLQSEGFEVVSASAQDQAIALMENTLFDLFLLDVTLAQGNGFAVCAAAKEAAPEAPVIFLTASDDEYSTVAGLDMGASDYIAKPFRARELISRIRAALRKTQGSAALLSAGTLCLNPTTASVTKGGREIILSALEYRLLLHFMQNKGRRVTRESLRDAIWDSAGEYVSDNAINVYIRRLRERIEDDPAAPKLIATVRGLGYKLNEDT